MHTKITGRHMEVTEAMRNYVKKKIPRLNKYHQRISEMEVIVDGEGKNHKIEIIIKADNHQRFKFAHLFFCLPRICHHSRIGGRSASNYRG